MSSSSLTPTGYYHDGQWHVTSIKSIYIVKNEHQNNVFVSSIWPRSTVWNVRLTSLVLDVYILLRMSTEITSLLVLLPRMSTDWHIPLISLVSDVFISLRMSTEMTFWLLLYYHEVQYMKYPSHITNFGCIHIVNNEHTFKAKTAA